MIMRHHARAMVEKLDFLTTLGHGPTGQERRRLGIMTAGPVMLVTDLCIMEPEPESNEFVVTALHPGVTREQVMQNSGWPVRFSSAVRDTEPPAPNELEALRELNARTAQAHAGRTI